jgi:Alpha/beta hydrolase domain
MTTTHPPVVHKMPGAAPAAIPHLYDLDALGYLEEEFLLEGTAHSYRIVGERTPDGHWAAEPSEEAHYRTRLLVRRPINNFSGGVVIEWLNVSAGLDAAPDWSLLHRHLIRRGHAWVGVSAQKVGIEGGGVTDGMHLKKLAPDRYGPLLHPGDAWSFDIFTQAGRALGTRAGSGPLGSLVPDRLLAAGESQSAMFLATYINAVDPGAAVYDGFFVHGRPATAASVDGRPPPARGGIGAAARTVSQRAERIRSDPRVPVLVLQSETDVALMGAGQATQPDGERIRLWELAGAAHADTYILVASAHDDGRLSPDQLADLLRPISEILGVPTTSPINAGPQQHYVGHGAIEHLDRWSSGGPPPPRAARLDLAGESSDIRRDRHGNAVGGIRTPWVDVPLATLSGLGQSGDAFSFLFGTTHPFDPAKLSALYPGGRGDYLDRFVAALDTTVADGFILDEDRDEVVALAAASFP